MKVYISGQITGLPIEVARDRFEKAEEHIRFKGHPPVNPMKVSPFVEGKTWEAYMLDDIAALFDCESIYMLNGWCNSRGARIELAIAQETGKRVVFEASPIFK